jgi:hypothetical protein
MRVVSLVPSVTETLTAWNVEPIACTRFCERPDLPHVGGTKNPDIAAIVALAPDLVVVDRHENRREDADALDRAGLQLCVLDVRSIDGLATELATLADATGVAPSELQLTQFEPLGMMAFIPIWRATTRKSPSTTQLLGHPTSCSCHRSHTHSPTRTSLNCTRSHPPSESTVKTCSGGAHEHQWLSSASTLSSPL